MRTWTVYLAGEIHSSWRAELIAAAEKAGLDVTFVGPVTDHDASDHCGVRLLGDEDSPFWRDRKGALVNALRTRTLIGDADVVVVRFGEQYRQWNGAFDAGVAAAQGLPLITLHDESRLAK